MERLSAGDLPTGLEGVVRYGGCRRLAQVAEAPAASSGRICARVELDGPGHYALAWYTPARAALGSAEEPPDGLFVVHPDHGDGRHPRDGSSASLAGVTSELEAVTHERRTRNPSPRRPGPRGKSPRSPGAYARPKKAQVPDRTGR